MKIQRFDEMGSTWENTAWAYYPGLFRIDGNIPRIAGDAIFLGKQEVACTN